MPISPACENIRRITRTNDGSQIFGQFLVIYAAIDKTMGRKGESVDASHSLCNLGSP